MVKYALKIYFKYDIPMDMNNESKLGLYQIILSDSLEGLLKRISHHNDICKIEESKYIIEPFYIYSYGKNNIIDSGISYRYLAWEMISESDPDANVITINSKEFIEEIKSISDEELLEYDINIYLDDNFKDKVKIFEKFDTENEYGFNVVTEQGRKYTIKYYYILGSFANLEESK